MDSPAYRYFVLGLRLQWSRRYLLCTLLAFCVVVIVQIVVTRALWYGSPGSRVGILGLQLAHSTYLINPLASLPDLQSPFPGSQGVIAEAWLVTRSVLWPAIWLVMPASMALSIVGERESLRLPEAALTRLRPIDILLGKAGSAALPFAVLVIAVVAGDVLTSTLLRGSSSANSSSIESFGFSMQPSIGDLLKSYAWPIYWVLVAVILTCVSSLCRSTTAAIPLCYGIVMAEGIGSLVVVPGLVSRWLPQASDAHALTSALVSLILLASAVALLLPRATRALSSSE
jgi:hypothetical protein